MLKSKSSPFEEDIAKATHENNLTEDWSLIMLICDNAINYDGGAKMCLKAIIKRLYHNIPRVSLQTLTLLDACVKNCDRRFLLQIASSEFTSEVRKLLPKMHPSASNKLKELLQRWSLEEFKDDPELCIIPALYYKLKSEGIEFPLVETKKKSPVLCTNPDGVSSQEEEEDIIKAIEISLKDTGRYEVPDEYKNVQPTSSSEPFSEPMKVRALYDFDAAEDNELTIKTGEIVVVLDCCSPSWWKGSNHRGEGLFPSNFVTKDLDVIPEEQKITEVDSKTANDPEIMEDSEIKLDEKKIELVIDWLNDTDPNAEVNDPEDMLRLEKQCYQMAPIIEENLQSIDKQLAMLNAMNIKIMDAFDLFHSLSDSIPVVNQGLKYYPAGALNQHIVQFPHPQVYTLPSPAGSMLHQQIQPSVPQQLQATPVNSQNISQSEPLAVSSTVQTSVTQDSTNPSTSNSSVSTVPLPAISDINQSVQTTAANNLPPTTLPFNLSNPVYNFSVMGGYCVPSPTMPYPLQCDPQFQQPGYIQNPASAAGVMTFPYAVPPMRPYFPVQYYYVNSNPPQNVAPPPVTSAVTSHASDPKPTISSTIAADANTTSASIPVVSSYSNDLQSLNLTSCPGDKPVDQQEILSCVQNDQLPSDVSKNEALNKNL